MRSRLAAWPRPPFRRPEGSGPAQNGSEAVTSVPLPGGLSIPSHPPCAVALRYPDQAVTARIGASGPVVAKPWTRSIPSATEALTSAPSACECLPHAWFDADSVERGSLMRAVSLSAKELPAAITPDRTLARGDAREPRATS